MKTTTKKEKKMDRKELPNKLANIARKIAFEDKVPTNFILEPLLQDHGFDNETYSITADSTRI